MVDLSLSIVRVRLPPKVVDLRCWFPHPGWALLGVVPWLSASEASVIAQAVFPDLIGDVRLPLGSRLVGRGVAIGPGGLLIGLRGLLSGLPNAWFLERRLIVGLLRFIFTLAVVISKLMFDD